ncbi:MAG TPA: C40 family peptidase [Phaeodactylibacter sp.]|nr:C40 family peptidase [Phaeodactylibacter sp.]
MRQLLLLFLTVLLFAQCSVFTRSYSYNNPRDERGTNGNEPERRERPLYEPLEKDEGSSTPETEEGEVEFEPDEETEEDASPKPAAGTEEARRLQAIDYAKDYLGTKYHFGGNTPQEGFDCSGFTRYVMDKVDVKLPRTSRSQEDAGQKVRLKKVQPGDLVFFRRTPVSKVFHVSIVLDNTADGIEVIHSTSRGVVIDNITKSSYWSPKISSARRVIGQ